MANSKCLCTGCKKRFPSESMFLVPGGRFHSMDCALEYIRKKNLVSRKKKEVAYKKETTRLKNKFRENDLPHQLELTQTVFNRLRKLQEYKWFDDRGLEPECISCGKINMDWANGHFKTVGSQGALRFDETNSFLQCNRYCNKGLSGNINGSKTTRGYLKGLAERFGQKEADRIIEYCEKDRVKKWTCDELILMRKQFNIEIRELEK